MAFTTPKYELIFSDVFQQATGTYNAYRLRIWKDGFSGTTYNMICGSSPISIETVNSDGNSYNPIVSTRATVNIINFTNFNILEFLNSDSNDFMLTLESGIYNLGYTWITTIWRGFFVPVESVQFNVVERQSYNLVFVDGLSKMKESRYFYDAVNGVGFSPRETDSIKDLIVSALAKTEQTIDVWINEYYKTASVASRNVDNLYLRSNYFLKQPGEYYTFYDILEGLCRTFGWECYYKEDKWLLTSYGGVTRENYIDYYVYNISGTYQSTQTVYIGGSTGIDGGNNFKEIDSSLLVSVNKPKYSLYNKGIIDNSRGLPNNRFISWTGGNLDGFVNNGVTAVQSFVPLGITISSFDTSPGGGSDFIVNQYPFAVKAGDYLSVEWKDVFNANTFGQYSVTIQNDSVTYYLQDDGTFSASPNLLPDWNTVSATWPDYSICPIDGSMYLTIYNPYFSGGGTSLQTIEYFIIQQYSVSSDSFNFDGVNYIASKDFKFDTNPEPNKQFGYFINPNIRDTITFIVNYNDKDQVTTDYFIGAYLDVNLLKVTDAFGRGTTGSSKLFTLVGQDIGIDELITQYTIEGEFKSIGFWINSKFNYSLDGITTENYLLKDIKWDVKYGTQQCKLCRINYNGTTITITTSDLLNVKK
jgi:hypothetical protein